MLDLDKLVSAITEEASKREELKGSTKVDENFLNCKVDNTYEVRLLPYLKNPANTFIDYQEYGWPSVIPGESYIHAGRTPKSIGRDDFVSRLQWSLYQEGKNSGDDAKCVRSYKLLPQLKQMVNVYVVSDSNNPENNGTVKILRYSSRINKSGACTGDIHRVIQSALFGDNKAEIGKRAFDLTENGCSLRIKVTENAGGWADYGESMFKFPSNLEGLTTSKIKAIYEDAKDLETFIPEVKSDSELRELIDKHWLGTNPSVSSEVIDHDDDDNLPGLGNDAKKAASLDSEFEDFLEGIED